MTSENPLGERRRRNWIRLFLATAMCGLLLILLDGLCCSQRPAAKRAACQYALRQLSVMLDSFAEAHDGHLPSGLDELDRFYANVEVPFRLLACPGAPHRDRSSFVGLPYRYFGSGELRAAPGLSRCILLCDVEGNHRGFFNALLYDGKVVEIQAQNMADVLSIHPPPPLNMGTYRH